MNSWVSFDPLQHGMYSTMSEMQNVYFPIEINYQHLQPSIYSFMDSDSFLPTQILNVGYETVFKDHSTSSSIDIEPLNTKKIDLAKKSLPLTKTNLGK